MQPSAVLQYPEFVFAGVIGILILLLGSNEEQSFACPHWLAQPAKSCFTLAPEHYLAWINKMLVQANWRSNVSFGNFACLKVYPALLSLFLLFSLPPYAVCAATILCFFAADLLLLSLVKRRQSEISAALPQAIDLMVLCVDAGLGLDATMQRISSERAGLSLAINDELNILGREIFLGMDREKAYQELYNRTGVDELKSLGSALHQASKLGLSVAKILRAQSDFIRTKSSQKAEERAMKMPIYMAFPLWFFIMPALLLLVLGPSLIKFYHAFHSTMP